MDTKSQVRDNGGFKSALRDLYSQPQMSSWSNLSSTDSRAKNVLGERNNLFLSLQETFSHDDIGFRGRGRPAFIPQEILDQPLRRPGSTVPPPLPDHSLHFSFSDAAVDAEFPQFKDFFAGKLVDNFLIYEKMEQYIFKEAKGLGDLQRMMQFFSKKALVCQRNASTICKYLYVFSQDPSVGSNLRTAFFGTLEKDYSDREEMRKREGPTKYRNFIRWMMATAHHYRNLLYAPFDELMVSLLELANEISGFNESEDYGLYVQLILRFYYYTSLPCSDGSKVSAKLGEEHLVAIQKAREHVRPRIARGVLTYEQAHWLMLLLEVTRSSPLIEKEIVDYYQKILPGFQNLLPQALIIKLPQGHGRYKSLEHIKKYVVV